MIYNHKCRLSRAKGGFIPFPALTTFILIKNWIRSATTISRENPLTRFDFRSVKSIEDERNRHINSKNWYIIHPYSMCSYHWMIVMMIVFTVAQPCDYIDNLHFTTGTKIPARYFLLMLIINFLHLIHIGVTFLTGYQEQTIQKKVSLKGLDKFEISVITLEPRRIATKYIKSYFLLDAVCVLSLPVIFVQYFSGKDIYQATPQCFRMFRMISVTKNFRILFLNFRSTDVIVNILKYITWVWITSMFFGSYQLIIPKTVEYIIKERRDTFMNRVIDIYRERGREKPSTGLLLLHSIADLAQNWVSPMMRIEKRVTEEKLLFIVLSFVGMIGKLCIFVGIFSLLNKRHLQDHRYKMFLEELKLFLKGMDVLQPLYGEAQEYAKKLMEGRYFRETDVLLVLPDTNKQSIYFDCSFKFITHCDLFMDARYEEKVSLTLKLKFELFLPGKKIIEFGDRLTRIYFIVSGTVAVIAQNDIELCHRSDGNYFGENGLLPNDNFSQIDVIAIEKCSLYVLQRSDFEKIVRNNRRMYEYIKKCIHIRQKRQTRKINAALAKLSK